MPNSLVTPADLADFPGAPFADAVVDAAVGLVRGEASWHIAPSVTETLTVDAAGGPWLLLPSLRLEAVTAVRDVSGDAPVTLTGWRKRRSGMLYREAGWPSALEGVEVDVTHGYPKVPPELLAVVAAEARAMKAGGLVTQESLGARSVSFAASSPMGRILARFTIPARA